MRVIFFYKDYINRIKPWFKKVFYWFLAGTVLGGLTFFVYPDLLDQILGIYEDKFGEIPALNFDLAIWIFLNNLRASAIALGGGLLVGLGPFLVVITNGFLLGYVIVSVTALSQGNNLQALGVLLAGLIPHGILEIPAFLLAAAIGLKLGIEWLKKEHYGQRLSILCTNTKFALWGIPLLVIMLFIAAIVEVYISGNLIDALTK